jgi:hypothetical protein
VDGGPDATGGSGRSAPRVPPSGRACEIRNLVERWPRVANRRELPEADEPDAGWTVTENTLSSNTIPRYNIPGSVAISLGPAEEQLVSRPYLVRAGLCSFASGEFLHRFTTVQVFPPTRVQVNRVGDLAHDPEKLQTFRIRMQQDGDVGILEAGVGVASGPPAESRDWANTAPPSTVPHCRTRGGARAHRGARIDHGADGRRSTRECQQHLRERLFHRPTEGPVVDGRRLILDGLDPFSHALARRPADDARHAHPGEQLRAACSDAGEDEVPDHPGCSVDDIEHVAAVDEDEIGRIAAAVVD